MSGTSTAFLGLIAAAAIVMAVVQVAIVVVVVRLVKRVDATLVRVERELGPLVERLTQMADNLQRAASHASTQIERVDHALAGAGRRANATLSLVQAAVVGPLREGLAVVAAVRGVLAGIRALRRNGRSAHRATRVDDEHPLFIG